jgi:hypothetical protein
VAECDGRVGLDVWPDAPHVFQSFASMLDEGVEALDALGASSTAGSPRSIPRGLREGLLELVDRLTRPHEPMSRSVPTSRSEHPLEQLAMLAGRDQIVWISNRRVRTLALTPMRRTADCGSLPVGVGPTSGDGES